MTNANDGIAETGSSSSAHNRRSLKVRLSFWTDSRLLSIVLPLLGGLGIAILAALIMRYV